MNERIKQLAIEADIMAPTWNHVPLGYQKFAQLIVEDVCADMLSLEPMYPANIVALKIRQKYGVSRDWKPFEFPEFKEDPGALDQYSDPAWQGKQK